MTRELRHKQWALHGITIVQKDNNNNWSNGKIYEYNSNYTTACIVKLNFPPHTWKHAPARLRCRLSLWCSILQLRDYVLTLKCHQAFRKKCRVSSIHANLPAAVQNSENMIPFCHLLVLHVFFRINLHSLFDLPILKEADWFRNPCKIKSTWIFHTGISEWENTPTSWIHHSNGAGMKQHWKHVISEPRGNLFSTLYSYGPLQKCHKGTTALKYSVGKELHEMSELIRKHILKNIDEQVQKKSTISRISRSGNVSDNPVWLFLSGVTGRGTEREPESQTNTGHVRTINAWGGFPTQFRR